MKGWCPTVYRPMEVEDGLLARLRPHMGRLTRDQVLGICRLAENHGNGLVELTSRASLQIRGLSAATHPDFLKGMGMLELLDPDLATEVRRSLVVTPYWRPHDLTHRLAETLSARLADLPELPAKFGFVIDTGPQPCLAETSGDIRIELGVPCLILRADGTKTGLAVTEEDCIERAIDLAHWFAATRTDEQRRMRDVTVPSDWQGTAPRLPARNNGLPKVDVPNNPFHARELSEALGEAEAVRLTPWSKLLVELPALETP